MRLTSTTTPDEWLADAFGRHAQLWAAEAGASALIAATVRHTAVSLSRATTAGHVCTDLGEIAKTFKGDTAAPIALAAFRQCLRDSHLVGTPQAPGLMPFILDADDRFYLHRYFDYEQRLARRLSPPRLRIPAVPRTGESLAANVTALLAALFPSDVATAGVPVDWQQVAVVTALLGRLTIISGGPGTGKTTAIVKLLACLLEQNPACRIALTAPTGKAAVRITETIRLRSATLPEPIRNSLPQKSSTIHRLLGTSPKKAGFLHDADNPLAIDVLVVDEASMLDLALATQLIEAVPPSARIILVGDKDQLAAVESGAVFAELSLNPRFSQTRIHALAQLCGVAPDDIHEPRIPATGGLSDSVVWLRHNYRFGSDSAIGRLAAATNAGDAEAALAQLRAAPSSSLTWIDDASATLSSAVTAALWAGYSHYVDACRASLLDPRAVTQAFGLFRVLCAVREGLRGTTLVNERVTAFFRHELDLREEWAHSEWYPGRPVVVLHNEYGLRLFNGDVGIALPDADGKIMVYFPDSEVGFRAVAPVRLPTHETAFAMTVHKAQGSEFDDVLVMLPAKVNRVLTRELLYTGVTRARDHVTLVGSADVLAHTIRTTTERLSGLSARLREAHEA